MTLGCAQLNPCRRLQRAVCLLSDDGIKFAPCQRFATSRVACACRDAPLLRHNITCACARSFSGGSTTLWAGLLSAIPEGPLTPSREVAGRKKLIPVRLDISVDANVCRPRAETTTVLFQVMSPARRQPALVQATYRRRSSTLAPYTR